MTRVMTQDDVDKSVQAAFVFVIPRYDWVLKRAEASEQRADRTVLLITAIHLGIAGVIFPLSNGADHSHLLTPITIIAACVAGLLGLAAIALSIRARSVGMLLLPRLDQLQEFTRKKTADELRDQVLSNATRQIRENTALINHRHRLIDIAIWMFAMEAFIGVGMAAFIYSGL